MRVVLISNLTLNKKANEHSSQNVKLFLLQKQPDLITKTGDSVLLNKHSTVFLIKGSDLYCLPGILNQLYI